MLVNFKVGANFKVFICLGSFQLRLQIDGKGWISRTGFLNNVNWTRECNFGAGRTLVCEHSNKTVPAFYTLPLQMVPEPLEEWKAWAGLEVACPGIEPGSLAQELKTLTTKPRHKAYCSKKVSMSCFENQILLIECIGTWISDSDPDSGVEL